MKYIDSNYFVELNKKVNSNEYNNQSVTDYAQQIKINDFSNSYYDSIRKQINKEGFSVVNTLVPTKSIEKITTWLEGLLGNIYNDRNPKKLPYSKIQAEQNAKYYINSNLAQPMHTDEGYTSIYPRYVALYCFENAQAGGDSIIAQVKPLYDLLIKNFPDNILLLFKKDAITLEGAKGVIDKPLLMRLENNHLGISYSSILKNMKCEDKVYEMYDYISNYLHDSKNQIRFKLQNGQILIFDNCRILHGRTRFVQNGNRLLYRFWFAPNNL